MFSPSSKEILHWQWYCQIYFTSSSNILSRLSNRHFFWKNCIWLLKKIMLHDTKTSEAKINLSKTDCHIFAYKWAPFSQYYRLNSIKICRLINSSQTALRVPKSRKLFSKNTTWKFMQICAMYKFDALLLDCCFREGVYHDSSWFSRKRLFALQRSCNSWQGLKKATRQIWLHNSFRSPRPVNEHRTIPSLLA